MRKKILFVLTTNPDDVKKYSFPPISLGYLVSSLKQSFGDDYFEFKIIDKNFYKEIKNFLPDIVCISSVTQNYNIAKEYAEYAKEKGTTVLVGGIHISTLPSSLQKSMDFGVIGEGEKTIVELIKAIENKSFDKVKGIVYYDGEKIVQTEKRPPLSVYEIPHPDRSLINDRYNCLIFSSRGCPFACIYCSYPYVFGKDRLFSASYIVEEIKEIFSRKINFINFADYLLSIDKNRLKQIIGLLKGEKILGKIYFSTSAYSNLIDKDVCELFKEMNIVSVSISFVSGVDRILKTTNSPHSLDDAKKAISFLKKKNISVYGSFVIGLPDEKKEDIAETLKFIKSSNLSYFDVYLPIPYPSTEFWKIAEERGLVHKNMDWDRLNTSFYNKKKIIISYHLTEEELHTEFKKFRRLKFFLKIKNIIFLFFKYLREKIS